MMNLLQLRLVGFESEMVEGDGGEEGDDDEEGDHGFCLLSFSAFLYAQGGCHNATMSQVIDVIAITKIDREILQGL